MRVERLTDKAVIRTFLGQDQARYAYMLGDLAVPYWPNAVFYGAFAGEQLRAIVLKYTPILPHPVITAGDPAGVVEVIRVLAEDEKLREMIYHAQSEHMAAIQRYFETPDATPMWRMAITRDRLSPDGETDGLRRLSGTDAEAAQTLFTFGLPSDFMTRQSPTISAGLLDSGVCYGVMEGGQLRAMAGTHIISLPEQIGAVGYVFTHPDSRGKGYAKRCTAAVTRDLFARGLTLVVLNVKQDNTPAIRAYERIGYVCHAPLWEGVGTTARGMGKIS
jgi:ribosomal protein S18 acetylase RimI-like enzyme